VAAVMPMTLTDLRQALGLLDQLLALLNKYPAQDDQLRTDLERMHKNLTARLKQGEIEAYLKQKRDGDP